MALVHEQGKRRPQPPRLKNISPRKRTPQRSRNQAKGPFYGGERRAEGSSPQSHHPRWHCACGWSLPHPAPTIPDPTSSTATRIYRSLPASDFAASCTRASVLRGASLLASLSLRPPEPPRGRTWSTPVSKLASTGGAAATPLYNSQYLTCGLHSAAHPEQPNPLASIATTTVPVFAAMTSARLTCSAMRFPPIRGVQRREGRVYLPLRLRILSQLPARGASGDTRSSNIYRVAHPLSTAKRFRQRSRKSSSRSASNPATRRTRIQ